MFSIKFFLLIFFVAPCIRAISPADQQVGSKINWEPVWDDLEGNNEFVYRIEDIESNEAPPDCNAPNGLGLKNFLTQVENILPKEQIKEILKSFDEDSEVKALRAFKRRPQTQEKLQIIRNSTEYKILEDYTCRILHVNLEQFIKLARSLISPPLARIGVEERKGIRGLIKAVDAILPYQQIHTLYRNLIVSDKELVKAVENLKSEEFQQLLLNVRNNVPAYKELSKELRDLGVPVQEMRDLFAKALVLWYSSEVTLFV